MTRLGRPYGECSESSAHAMSHNMNEDRYNAQYSKQVSYNLI